MRLCLLDLLQTAVALPQSLLKASQVESSSQDKPSQMLPGLMTQADYCSFHTKQHHTGFSWVLTEEFLGALLYSPIAERFSLTLF